MITLNIIFAGSKGKTGSIVFNYLKNKGYKINSEINLNSKSLKDVIIPNSIVIDFTTCEVALLHAKICLKTNSHFICGTTGIDKEEINKILKEANKKKLKFIFSPNFAIGINTLIPFLSSLKENFNKASITESHHISKKDLPSGTALLIKDSLKEDTTIESIRTTSPSLKHIIKLENDDEEIIIEHNVKNKNAYAKGVEKCLKKHFKKE